MAGAAWPMLATAITGLVNRRMEGRVSTIPSGMAITNTISAATSVRFRCSTV
jgi:hypothetical protein